MTIDTAKEEVARLKHEGCFDPMQASAKKHGLPLEFVCAIASRETNCANELGDFHDGVYYAVGVMQIDIQHGIAREAMVDQSWKDYPDALIEFGCALLSGNRAAIQARFPDLLQIQALKLTAASYSVRMSASDIEHLEGGLDNIRASYRCVAYAADVMGRMPTFKTALAEGPRPKRKVATR
jgi:hypothetical protein